MTEENIQISQSTKDAMDRLGIPLTEGLYATTTPIATKGRRSSTGIGRMPYDTTTNVVII